MLIGQVFSGPYTVNWLNVSAGSYTLTAVATDSSGRVTSSTENVTVINPVKAQNDAPTVFENMTTNIAVLANDTDQESQCDIICHASIGGWWRARRPKCTYGSRFRIH